MKSGGNQGTPWLEIAKRDIGAHEVRGESTNPRIAEMFQLVGHPGLPDEVSWCATAVGAWLRESNLPIPPANVNLMARSYLTYGVRCEPKPGAIAIWPRNNSAWQGHVNIVEEVTADGKVICIGGNQALKGSGGAVTRTKPLDPSEALAFRWPIEPTVKDLAKVSRSVDQLKKAKDIAVIGASGSAALGALKEGTDAIVPVAPVPDPSVIEQIHEASKGASDVKALVDTVSGMATALSSNGWVVVLVVCVAGYVIARRVLGWRVEEILSGRYRPSGGA